ncbi:hypothetical protein FIBSPDRAFT_890864 [Athelia psychrophila]|uniref:Uncharacterized protein n=1 Tax=Athelia psychrophila TaxID=1759441 RepID=A0A166KG00_9AGAM|nr:hypothetical protein FIBSPDRAFT_890864 [Fibularhizoctonia sp. CBS 109695]
MRGRQDRQEGDKNEVESGRKRGERGAGRMADAVEAGLEEGKNDGVRRLEAVREGGHWRELRKEQWKERTVHVDDRSTQKDCCTARRLDQNNKKLQDAGLGCARTRSGGGRTGTAGRRTHRGSRSAGWVRALRVLNEENGGRGLAGGTDVLSVSFTYVKGTWNTLPYPYIHGDGSRLVDRAEMHTAPKSSSSASFTTGYLGAAEGGR